MNPHPFEVLSIEPLRLDGPEQFLQSKLMSPFVWQQRAGRYSMLVRVVPEDGKTTGSIWFATGDGIAFHAEAKPILEPGPDDLDIRGCEDPTVVPADGECIVYYTGVRKDGVAQLLYASGPDVHSLTKRGVAHASTSADKNTKEAAVERSDGRWLLLFEYSRDDRSRMGRAEGEKPAGPWKEQADPLIVRPNAWDSWHLSTGPLLLDEPDGPLMFYNGADAAGNWAIGWVRFDECCRSETARCDRPLISSPTVPGPDGRRIAFAASAVSDGAEIALYYSENDRSLHRANLRRT